MSDFHLTQEQQLLVEQAATQRRLYVTGPRCSGKTTTLLHAAMQAMTELKASDSQVCLLTPDDTDPRPIKRSLERTLALSQMRILGIRQFTRSLHINLGPEDTRQKNRAVFRSSYSGDHWERRAQAQKREVEMNSRTAQEAFSKQDELLSLGNKLIAYGYEQHTITDMYLVAAALIRKAQTQPGLQSELNCPYRILLVDDFETFSLAQGHLLRMLYGRGAVERVMVTETRASLPSRGGVSETEKRTTALTHRMNRGEILDVQRQFQNEAVPLVPVRGYGGSFNVKGLREGEDRRSTTPELDLQRQQERTEDFTLRNLRKEIQQIIQASQAGGRDVAVLASRNPEFVRPERQANWDYESHTRRQDRTFPSYAARELQAAFGETYTAQAVRERSRAVERLTHAVMAWCGLTIPNGLHLQLRPPDAEASAEATAVPLNSNERIFPVADPEMPDLTPEQVDALYDQFYIHEPIDRVRSCQSTSEIMALVQHPPQPALDLPEDPFQALDVLLSLPYQPRLIIDQLENVSGHFSDLILVMHQQEPPPVEMLTQALSRCLNHFHLIYLMPHPDKTVRTVAGLKPQHTSPMTRIKAGEQQTKLMHQVLQDRPPPQDLKDALEAVLQVADLRTYLSTYAPHHVRPELLTAWEAAMVGQPFPLIDPREPSRRWHHDVSLFHDDHL